MSEHRDVVVIGAGLLGLAAAWALARRGSDVVVLDQAPVGHAGSGSKGSCRVFRFGYEDPLYTELVWQAREVWDELEDVAGEKLLHPTPQLTFGRQMPVILEVMRQTGAAHQLLSAAEAAERFPGLACYGQVLLEPESAVIAADRTLAALARAVPEIRVGVRVTALRDDGRKVLVGTQAGDIEAGCVIICAGPWTARLLATAGITLPASATAEQVAYLAPTDAGASGLPVPGMPIFIHYGDDVPYGLPVPGSRQYKVGIHHDGTVTDPDHQVQVPDAALSRRIEQTARRFLPGHDPVAVATERCVYDNSPDEDFIVDRIGNLVIGSGTSGHGFKFGPMLGGWLAALAIGPERPGGRAGPPAGVPPRRFALSRFG